MKVAALQSCFVGRRQRGLTWLGAVIILTLSTSVAAEDIYGLARGGIISPTSGYNFTGSSGAGQDFSIAYSNAFAPDGFAQSGSASAAILKVAAGASMAGNPAMLARQTEYDILNALDDVNCIQDCIAPLATYGNSQTNYFGSITSSAAAAALLNFYFRGNIDLVVGNDPTVRKNFLEIATPNPNFLALNGDTSKATVGLSFSVRLSSADGSSVANLGIFAGRSVTEYTTYSYDEINGAVVPGSIVVSGVNQGSYGFLNVVKYGVYNGNPFYNLSQTNFSSTELQIEDNFSVPFRFEEGASMIFHFSCCAPTR